MSTRMLARWPGLALALLLGVLGMAHAESPTGCGDPRHRDFDFWVGRWEVSAGGRLAGHNEIVADLRGCVLLESWSGASGTRGRSQSFYDAARDRWHQTWVDDEGGTLYLDGGLVGPAMVLEGTTPGPTGVVHERITWTPNPDGTVRQHWEQRSEGSSAWRTSFDGLYRRMPADPAR
ncbi:MAG: hypothetical protein JSR73_04985 [Proteobacteria bacterium]|nr:hypothetical protein [Pseudomonadota bacterium]